MPMPTEPKARDKIVNRMRKLHAKLGDPDANTAMIARQHIIEILHKYGLSWTHLEDILQMVPRTAAGVDDEPPPQQQAPKPFNVLNLVDGLLEKYVGFTAQQRLAAALWVLHCYVFDRFNITPRLALLSPVRGCGKTTLLLLLEQLLDQVERSDNVSAASIYRLLAESFETPALLLDEGDNLGLLNNNVLRTVMNSGHRRGGIIRRAGVRYPTFAPMAVAAIGILPLPLMQRCVILNMQRTDRPLERLNELDPDFVVAMTRLRHEIQVWANNCQLNQDPPMPANLKNRAADNWRILLAIADDLGRGEEARSAALALTSSRIDEDIPVLALHDIRTIFTGHKVDRMSSDDLTLNMVNLESDMWLEWRGPHDSEPPHKLTKNALARMLAPFGIHPKPMNDLTGKRARGYYRYQFEEAWRNYCPSTPTERAKPRSLPKPKAKRDKRDNRDRKRKHK